MSPCHNLEPSLVARDSSRLLSVKPNEWMHLSPFYTRMHGEWLRYAKSTSQFHWRFLLVRDVRGFQVNPLCRHDITSPFPPSGNGGYVRNLDVMYTFKIKSFLFLSTFDVAPGTLTWQPDVQTHLQRLSIFCFIWMKMLSLPHAKKLYLYIYKQLICDQFLYQCLNDDNNNSLFNNEWIPYFIN